MILDQHILEIQHGLRTGAYRNEAAISHGVVMRLLQGLGWPVFDSTVVIPEYASGRGRVDFALCHPSQKPVAFIEVKQQGQSEGGDRQLFEYAFHEGVPMAILTDGQEWNFYLPAEQGAYNERRVYKLDLLERERQESEHRLSRYLSYERICTGEALTNARTDYRDAARRRDIERVLPEAWTKLLQESDALLVDLLAERVEDMSGFKPDADTVSKFLQQISVGTTPVQMPVNRKTQTSKPSIPKTPNTGVNVLGQTPSRLGFVLLGEQCDASSAKEVLIQVLRRLAARDRTFLSRFASRPKHGRKRRYIATNPNDLYPGRPDLAHLHEKIDDQYYAGTNYAIREIQKILQIACEVAEISFGRDLTVQLEK